MVRAGSDQTVTLSAVGVKFRPTFYNLHNEQRRKASIRSKKDKMVAPDLYARGNHELRGYGRRFKPNQVGFVGHRMIGL